MVILAFSWMVTDEVCSLTVLNNYRSKPDHVLLLISQEKGSCYFWVTPPVTHQSHYLDQFCFTFIIVSQGFILQLLFLLKFWMPQIFPGCFFFTSQAANGRCPPFENLGFRLLPSPWERNGCTYCEEKYAWASPIINSWR